MNASRCLPWLLCTVLLLCGCRDEAGGLPREPGSANGETSEVQPAGNSPTDMGTPVPQASTPPPGLIPRFETVGEVSGFAFTRFDDIRGECRITEANGGGAGLIDYDRDGLLDILMLNGCRLPLETDTHETPSELFRNRGKMTFAPVARQALLVPHGFSAGCTVGDFDGDGFDDLYVTAFGRNSLWINQGDGTFVDVTESAGVMVPEWSSSAAFADLNRDGHLDLFVVNYLHELDSAPRLCREPASPTGYRQCSPAIFDGVDDVLFLSDGSGGMVNHTQQFGLTSLAGKGLGVVVSDLNDDLQPEVYVANDGQANFLLVPQWDAITGELAGYHEQALLAGVALSEAGYAQAGMGIAAGDCDGNGTIDLFLTHFYGDTNTLYLNQGGLTFQEATRRSRLGPPSRQTLGFGTMFFDPDLDGRLDLIVANGHVEDRSWILHGEPHHHPPQLFRNEGPGEFHDVSIHCGDYFLQKWIGRGLAVGDLDRDGKEDVVVSHQLDPSVILRNITSTPHAALNLQLVGVTSNRSGIGTRIERTAPEPMIIRELIGGGSFQSASALEVQLALPEGVPGSIRIRWPSGLTEEMNLLPGSWLVVEGIGVYRRPQPEINLSTH